MLADSVAGELIRVGDRDPLGPGREPRPTRSRRQREARAAPVPRSRPSADVLLGATGTHPWSPWQEQHIIDTEHYRRVRGRASSTSPGATTPSAPTCTWACRAPTARWPSATACGRCCRSCWRSRPTRRSSTAATRACTPRARRSSPRASRAAGSRTRSASWRGYADYVDFLVRTNSIVEHTQIWWSVRPHHAFGTVEVRICDAQTSAEDVDRAGRADRRLRRPGGARLRRRRAAPSRPARRLIEENFWRAIRYGLDGKLIDLERGEEFPAAAIGGPPAGLDRAGARARSASRSTLPERERRPAPAARRSRRAPRSRRSTRAEVASSRSARYGGERRWQQSAMSDQPGQPSEEELRAALEEQLRQITVEDVLLADHRHAREPRRAAADGGGGEGPRAGPAGDRGRAGAAAALPRGGARRRSGTRSPSCRCSTCARPGRRGGAAPERTAGEPSRGRRAGRPIEDLDASGHLDRHLRGLRLLPFLDDVEEVAVDTPYGPPSARIRLGGSRAGWPSCRGTATSTRCRRTGSTTAPTSGRCGRSACGGSSGPRPAAR